jgi:ATP-dependent DNA helicase
MQVHVVVTSFEIAMRDVAYFQRPGRWSRWKYLAVDEGHRLKNKDCRLIRELKSIPVDNRLLLTGTPLQNDLTELWSLLNFILPEIFDSLAAFQSWFDFDSSNIVDAKRIIQQEQENSIVAKLHSIMKPFMLRRQKKDVDLDIPLKKEIVVYCSSSEQQIEMYMNILKYRSVKPPEDSDDEIVMGRGMREKDDVCYDEDNLTEQQFTDAVEKEKDMDEIEENSVVRKHGTGKKTLSRANAIKSKKVQSGVKKTSLNNMLMQLRKVCNHPYLFEEMDPMSTDESIVTNSGKMALLDRLLPTLFAEGHKVLIFSQMTKMLAIIEDYMILRKFTYCRLDGSTKLDERQEQMDEFNNCPTMNCFLLSTRAGGLGINLVAADTVIIFDSDWNPQADLQAQDRCHRIGQKNPVLVYRFCAAHSVEEKMIEKASNKRRLEHLVVSNGKFVEAGATSTKDNIKSIDVNELMDMLKDNYADQKVKGTLSDDDVRALMDRSSLFRVAGKPAPTKSKLFKVLEDDGGDVSVF